MTRGGGEGVADEGGRRHPTGGGGVLPLRDDWFPLGCGGQNRHSYGLTFILRLWSQGKVQRHIFLYTRMLLWWGTFCWCFVYKEYDKPCQNAFTSCHSQPFTNTFIHHGVSLPSEMACSSRQDTMGTSGFRRRRAPSSFLIAFLFASFSKGSLLYWYKTIYFATNSFLWLKITFSKITLHLHLHLPWSDVYPVGACPAGQASSCRILDKWVAVLSWRREYRRNFGKKTDKRKRTFFTWINVTSYLAFPYFISSWNSSQLGTVCDTERCCFKLL